MNLPAGFADAGNLAAAGQFPKTNPTHVKVPEITSFPAATKTPSDDASGILWFFFGAGNNRIFGHNFYFLVLKGIPKFRYNSTAVSRNSGLGTIVTCKPK